MSEEEISTPSENTIQPEINEQQINSVEEVVTPPPASAANRNILHILIIVAFLLPLNYVVYHSYKASTKNGDNGNASSADGLANLLNATKDKPSYDSYLGLGVAYYNTHRFQEAIDAWQKGLEFNANSPILYSNIGASYNCLSNWAQGKANCEKALAIDPNFGLARNNLNWAVSELAKAGTPVPANTNTQANNTGPVPAAPNAAFNALLNQGLNYYNQKNFTEAINVWKKALVLNPNSEIVYSNMGAAYGCLYMWREQVAACKKALAINPNYQLAANNLAWGESELKKRGMTP